PLRITHLVVCLHGSARVFKNPVAPADAAAAAAGLVAPGRGRRNGEYRGNGLATLFEDEVVLCGDGRLREGVYHFRFELAFPPYSLPSSISFERGAIAYVLTATLTRPTTISPTMTCDANVLLLESIDIAHLPVPKPRVISLEPVARRSALPRTRSKAASDELPPADPPPPPPPPPPPRSPVPSERSHNSSCRTNSTQSFHIVSEPSSARGLPAARPDDADADHDDGLWPTAASPEITATARVLRAGVLPGDLLPITLAIKHSKPVRSANGVIITLYRLGRIDMYPQLPVGTPEHGKKPVFEDYYPKSRTGLGGLSFGVTRTTSVFRKDLSQVFCPLIVDPTSMTADIKASIRIPENAFPTITRVPGAMISFRYYVELVVDIRGKLTGHDRFPLPLPRINMTGHHGLPAAAAATSHAATTILDTDHVRRDKSVISCLFEVTVGSKDSSRRQRPDDSSLPDHPQTPPPPADEYHPLHPTHDEPPVFVPPPQPEETVDEKTRLRRAEEMLLPSAPPLSDDDDPGGPSSSASLPPPSAPVLDDCSEYFPSDFPPLDHHHHHHHPRNASPAVSAPSTDTITPTCHHSSSPDPHHTFPYSPPPASPPPWPHPTDDKQELERQRLLAQASAPPPDDDDDLTAAAVAAASEHGAGPSSEVPSAPVLTEEDIMGHPVLILEEEESLPRYQRGNWDLHSRANVNVNANGS
ncbi:ph-response sensor protein, partial [Ophidiomyces ophidiicola]